MFLLLLQGLELNLTTVIVASLGLLGTALGVYQAIKSSRIQVETKQLEIRAQTFEVEVNAKQKAQETEITATREILTSWKEQSAGQSIRIGQVETDLRTTTDLHNSCERRCAKLEGQVEMLSSLQGITTGKMNAQNFRQDAQDARQNVQEERQNAQEGKQVGNLTRIEKVEKVDINADQVEVKSDKK